MAPPPSTFLPGDGRPGCAGRLTVQDDGHAVDDRAVRGAGGDVRSNAWEEEEEEEEEVKKKRTGMDQFGTLIHTCIRICPTYLRFFLGGGGPQKKT